MLQGLYAAASGMEAMQDRFDSVSNDMANLDTPGYQGTEMGFQTLLYTQGGVSSGSTVATGAGVRSQIVGRDQSEGSLQQTGRSLDVALDGPGYLQVRRPDGSAGLTRNGALQVSADGRLTDSGGHPLVPAIAVPRGTDPSSLTIAADGRVSAGGRTLGQISVVDVPAPGQLSPAGDSLYAPTAGSGAPRAQAGTAIHQGALEGSNVDVAQDMTEMVNAQRTYQMASKAIEYQDQMLQIANQLRR